jgi:hypothetical protein
VVHGAGHEAARVARATNPQGVVIGGWGACRTRRTDVNDPGRQAEHIHTPSLDCRGRGGDA